MNNGKSDYWVCNVTKENLPKIKKLIFTSKVWNTRPKVADHWGGTSKPRFYIHGRNPNRKQFRTDYNNCSTGTQSSIRVEHATYFGVYVNNREVVPQLRQLVLENQ
jgi:hypothetical protein